MNPLDVVIAAGKAVIWMGAYAQAIGMPIAWVRLRQTDAWRNRPPGLRRIDLLAQFVLLPTAATVVWAWFWILAAALGGFSLSGTALLTILLGAPLIFVPWAILRDDKHRFPVLVEEVRQRRERKLAER